MSFRSSPLSALASCARLLAITGLAAVLVPSRAHAEPKPIRVLVWDERQPDQKQAYENFLGNQIADYLSKQPGFTVKSVGMDDPEQGLDKATLDGADVLIWWGHRRHPDVNREKVNDIVARIKDGRLSLVALHSSHFSQPFTEAMCERAKEDAIKAIPADKRATATLKINRAAPFTGPTAGGPLTPSLAHEEGTDIWTLTMPLCGFPAWDNNGKPSHIKTLLPEHPIAKGIPAEFDVPQTEMYAEPFHVPTPDAVLFDETFSGGQHFHSGSVWKVGKGSVFYFRPGHETYPIFKQPVPLKIVENAVRFVAPGQ